MSLGLQFVLPWRAKKGRDAPYAKFVRRFEGTLTLPAGSIATKVRVAKLRCNYENEQQN